MTEFKETNNFGIRGAELWAELTRSNTLGPAHIALAVEACRLVDRLDRMHEILSGRSDRLIDLTDSAGATRLVVDGLLSQARMHATALRGIVAELRQAGAVPAAEAEGEQTTEAPPADVADLVARINERRAGT